MRTSQPGIRFRGRRPRSWFSPRPLGGRSGQEVPGEGSAPRRAQSLSPLTLPSPSALGGRGVRKNLPNFAVVALLLFGLTAGAAERPRPMAVEDLWKLQRVGAPTL